MADDKKQIPVDKFLGQYTDEAIAEDMICLIMNGDLESAKQSLNYLQQNHKDKKEDDKKDKK